MEIELRFNTAFHPQNNGQLKRTIHISDKMLQMSELDFKEVGKTYSPLADFVDDNCFYSSFGMAPYEAL